MGAGGGGWTASKLSSIRKEEGDIWNRETDVSETETSVETNR